MAIISRISVGFVALVPLFVLVGCAVDETKSSGSEIQPSSSTPDPNQQSPDVGFGAAGAAKDDSLTLDEMLTYAIQDEFLAKAQYELAIKEFGTVRPFSNTINAETQHISLLTALFEQRKSLLPVDDSAKYLTAPTDIKAALTICADGEVENIEMYERFLEQNLPADVRGVFEQLKFASENHLRAFQNNLSRY